MLQINLLKIVACIRNGWKFILQYTLYMRATLLWRVIFFFAQICVMYCEKI